MPAKSSEHPVFSAADNDIVLRTKDEYNLGFRRLYLESASEVWEGMVGAGRADGARKKDHGGRDVVELPEEDGEVLATLLLHIHPRHESPQIRNPNELEQLCLLADKYAVVSVLSTLWWQAERFCRTHPPIMLGLALIYKPPRIAALALLQFNGPDFKVAKHTTVAACDPLGQVCACVPAQVVYEYKDPNFLISDIPFRLSSRIPPFTLWALNMIQSDILRPNGVQDSWKKVARMFDKNSAWLSSPENTDWNFDTRESIFTGRTWEEAAED